MRQRKFSFDLPRLKLGAFKYENRPWNDHNAAMAMEPESPGEVPKSIRPLPHDLDAALRAACTGVLRNNKPSHEYHKGGRAQLDYATIRRGGGNNPAPPPRRPEPAPAPGPVSLSKSTSNENRANRDSTMSPNIMGPEKPQRMSHISTSADIRPPSSQTPDGAKRRSRAQSRADQLMAGSPPKAPEPQRERTNSQHSRSQSTPQNSFTFPAPKLGSIRRPNGPPRAQSMELTATLTTPGNQLRASPNKLNSEGGPTSPSEAVISQPLSSTAEVKEDYDADWIDEAERKRLLQQQAFAMSALSRHATWIPPKQEEGKDPEAIEQEPSIPAAAAQVPERKPVPKAEPVASPEPTSIPSSPAVESPGVDRNSVNSEPVAPAESLPSPTEQRSESRNDRGRTRGIGVPMNSRAVSRARSITREVKDFMRNVSRNASRNASRTRQPRARVADDASTDSRSRRPSMSRTRDVANNVKEYFRPGAAADKQSLDVPRNNSTLKSKSHESFVSAKSDASPAKDTPMQQSQRSSRHNKVPSTGTDKNSFEADREERITQNDLLSSETLQQKRQVDLNRALPPLPRLDSWHDDTFTTPGSVAPASPDPVETIELIRAPQGSGLPSPTLASQTTLKRLTSRESKSPLPSPKLGGVHDYVALRMGAPVSRQASKAKVRNPNLTQQRSRPTPSRAPAESRHSRAQPSDYGFPASTTQAKRDEVQAARRRSRSMQDVNPPDLSEKLRKASANAPDGRSIHAVGQAKLVDTSTRGQLDGLAGRIGRKLSTKRPGRNVTPTQPPPPPPHRELPQRKAKTATSTPHGLSRANSTYHSQNKNNLSRKMSLEEYGQAYDDRYHKNNSGLLPPPPVAASSSKNSPRMNLGNFLPSKFQQQQPQQQQQSQHSHQQSQSGSKKWWHLGLGNAGDNMESAPRSGAGMEQNSGGLGVRY